jgi:hypothetical protein
MEDVMSIPRSAVIVAVVLLLAAPAAFAGSWVKSKGGCLVWSANPQPNETVDWKGACADGKAQGPGTQTWYVAGKPVSEAKGTFVQGFMRGTVDFKDPAWGVYQGEWYEDEKCAGPQGIGTAKMKGGARYEGRWRCGKRDGTGTMSYANGTKFVGSWQADQAYGVGTLTRGGLGHVVEVQCTASKCKPKDALSGWERVP